MPASLYEIPLVRIDGTPASLADYQGKVLLIVNVASKCGLTRQYESLQKLYEEKQEHGLVVLGFPANNFKAQEPGTEAEISAFCSTNYGVTFPMFQKISVVGDDRHPLYDALVAAYPQATDTEAMRARLAGHGIEASTDTDVLWNFEKFVISRDGQVIARFSPDITVDDPRMTTLLNDALTA